MGTSRKGTAAGGDRYQCFRNVLLGVGESGSIDWILIVVHVGGDDRDSRVNPHELPNADHSEEGTEKYIWEMGNTGRQRVVEGIWNTERVHIHWTQAGNSGTVGGFKTNI